MEAGALRAPAARNRISVTAPLLRLRSDEQLVAIFRAGNDAAFSVIHDRYRQRLFAYSRQMLGGSRQDAEDAMQDVFLRAYSSLRSNDRPLSLRAWLYRVAHNRCIDHLRRPMPPAADLLDTSRKPLHDPMDEAVRREDLRQLVADVRRLPAQQRSALLMREMDGMSYAELAEALSVSLPAVKSLLVRARIGLVEAVEARDTACSEIRLNLADTCDRGVRASGLTRRHLRDCDGCSEYRTQLRSVSHGLSILAPGASGMLTGALKLIGLGGAGSAGAASAGGAGAAGSGVLAAATTGTAAKVAAVVCCAALTATSAVEVRERIVQSSGAATAGTRQAVTPSSQRGAAALVPARSIAAAAAAAVALRHRDVATPAAPTVSTTGRHTRSTPSPTPAVAPGSADPTATGAPAADTTTGGATAPHEGEGLTPASQHTDGSPTGSSTPAPAPTASSAPAATTSKDGVVQATPASEGANGGASAPTGAGAKSASGSIPPG